MDTVLFTLITLLVLSSCVKHKSEVKRIESNYDSTWWNRKPVRIIQTNLREIDATMDRESYIQSLVNMSVNAVLINVGGIVANYPTELEYHWKNTFMEGDLIGDLIGKLQSKGIKVIGRFDFSKLNEAYAFKNPDWLYKGVKGNYVNYNGQVHVCINGGYEQEYAFKILEEAIMRYPLDGIFFNMIGYKTGDYSGNYHGICQCNNCKKRFFDSTGFVLPTIEDYKDPIYLKYIDFKKKTSADLFYRIRDFIKELKPDMVINTYTSAGVDWRRRESETFFNQHRDWNYSATDHVRADLCTYPDKSISNAARHFVGLPFRHSACHDELTRIRLTANLLNGAILDFYCIGPLTTHEDKFGFDKVKDIFTFQANNEYYFNNLKSIANICVIKGQRDEYRGILRILSANHIQYDIIHQEGILKPDLEKPIDSYEVLIITELSNMSKAQLERIDKYVETGGKVIVTGKTSINDEIGYPLSKIRLKSLGVGENYKLFSKGKGTYLKFDENDKSELYYPEMEKLSISFIHSDFMGCTLKENAKSYLKYIANAMYGPPEKCYYTNISDYPGLVYYEFGKGATVFFPWSIGENYERKGHHSHSILFMSSLLNLLEFKPDIQLEASPLLEVNRMEQRDQAFEFIGLINHSGQLGASYFEPLEMKDIKIELKTDKMVNSIRTLREDQKISYAVTNKTIKLILPVLKDFEIIVIE